MTRPPKSPPSAKNRLPPLLRVAFYLTAGLVGVLLVIVLDWVLYGTFGPVFVHWIPVAIGAVVIFVAGLFCHSALSRLQAIDWSMSRRVPRLPARTGEDTDRDGRGCGPSGCSCAPSAIRDTRLAGPAGNVTDRDSTD
jgi:hypothetical protein